MEDVDIVMVSIEVDEVVPVEDCMVEVVMEDDPNVLPADPNVLPAEPAEEFMSEVSEDVSVLLLEKSSTPKGVLSEGETSNVVSLENCVSIDDVVEAVVIVEVVLEVPDAKPVVEV